MKFGINGMSQLNRKKVIIAYQVIIGYLFAVTLWEAHIKWENGQLNWKDPSVVMSVVLIFFFILPKVIEEEIESLRKLLRKFDEGVRTHISHLDEAQLRLSQLIGVMPELRQFRWARLACEDDFHTSESFKSIASSILDKHVRVRVLARAGSETSPLGLASGFLSDVSRFRSFRVLLVSSLEGLRRLDYTQDIDLLPADREIKVYACEDPGISSLIPQFALVHGGAKADKSYLTLVEIRAPRAEKEPVYILSRDENLYSRLEELFDRFWESEGVFELKYLSHKLREFETREGLAKLFQPYIDRIIREKGISGTLFELILRREMKTLLNEEYYVESPTEEEKERLLSNYYGEVFLLMISTEAPHKIHEISEELIEFLEVLKGPRKIPRRELNVLYIYLEKASPLYGKNAKERFKRELENFLRQVAWMLGACKVEVRFSTRYWGRRETSLKLETIKEKSKGSFRTLFTELEGKPRGKQPPRLGVIVVLGDGSDSVLLGRNPSGIEWITWDTFELLKLIQRNMKERKGEIFFKTEFTFDEYCQARPYDENTRLISLGPSGEELELPVGAEEGVSGFP